MDIRIRSCETNEVLHTISVEPDDERRDDLVKQALGRFELDEVAVYVEDVEDDEAADDVEQAKQGDEPVDDEPTSLAGDGAPRDDEATTALGRDMVDDGGAADSL